MSIWREEPQLSRFHTVRLTGSAEPTHSPECKFGHLGSCCRPGVMKTVQFTSVKWTASGRWARCPVMTQSSGMVGMGKRGAQGGGGVCPPTAHATEPQKPTNTVEPISSKLKKKWPAHLCMQNTRVPAPSDEKRQNQKHKRKSGRKEREGEAETRTPIPTSPGALLPTSNV